MAQSQRRVYDLRHFCAGAKVAQNWRIVCCWDKKRNVVVDSKDLEDSKQQEGETFQEYLITVTDHAEEANVIAGHCDACQKTCLDRRLASHIISGIRDGETRRKLLVLSPFPTLDKVKDICSAEESAQKDDVTMDEQAEHSNQRHQH